MPAKDKKWTYRLVINNDTGMVYSASSKLIDYYRTLKETREASGKPLTGRDVLKYLDMIGMRYHNSYTSKNLSYYHYR